MIFRFVVRHFRWLGRMPLLPQLFDALLLMATALTNRPKLRAIELLVHEVQGDCGAELRSHRFGGTGFCVGRHELGHVHGNGLVDALIGPANRDKVVGNGTASAHHIFPRSGWVSFWMRDESDVPAALDLMRLALTWRQIAERDASHALMKNE